MAPEVGARSDRGGRLDGDMVRGGQQDAVARERGVRGLVLLHGRAVGDGRVDAQRAARRLPKLVPIRRDHVNGRARLLLGSRALRNAREERDRRRCVRVAVCALAPVDLWLWRRIFLRASGPRPWRELRVDEAASLAVGA